MARLSRRSRRLILGATVVTLATTVLLLVWRWEVTPVLTRRLALALGHEVQVGSWSPGFRTLTARDVRILGVPPFEQESAATIEVLRIGLGGATGMFSPSSVTIEGLDLSFLGTLQNNNLVARPRRDKPNGPGRPPRAPQPAIAIEVRSGRLSGVLLLRQGLRLAFRARELSLARTAEGALEATLGAVTADLQDMLSFRVPGLTLKWGKAKQLAFHGAGIAIQIPRGGDLVSGLVVEGEGSAAALRLAAHTEAPSPHAVSGKLRWERAKATLTTEFHLEDLPLQPLDPLLKRRALGLSRAKGSLDGTLHTALDSWMTTFTLALGITDFDLQHPAWDRAPWEGLTATARLAGEFDLLARRLAIPEGRASLLGLELDFASNLSLAGPPKGDFRLATRADRRLSCAAIWNAQPAPFKQVLRGLSVEGELAFRLAIAFDAANWEQTQLTWKLPTVCQVKAEPQALARLYPVLSQPSAPAPPGTKLALGKFHPDFVKLSTLPPYVPNAFITSEDSKFFRHNGFDLEMMRLALAQDLASRTFSRGASTITQQLAKNLFLSHQRTLARKLEEAIFTWRLHRLLAKDRILELYLNIIELGPGIQGLRQASQRYFGKDPALLTPLEAAHLAALTPNPHILAKRFRYGQVDEGWRQRLIDLLGMMKRTGRLTAEELAKARTATLSLRPLDQSARRRP